MWPLHFYRFYLSFASAVAVYVLAGRSIWLALGSFVVCRAVIWLGEKLIRDHKIARSFETHGPEFRQEFGPYGIRLMNKAQDDNRIKSSLAEVFVSSTVQLRKTVEQLEMLDTLFNAGLRPQGDEYLLHDLKLKYGKKRLEQIQGA